MSKIKAGDLAKRVVLTGKNSPCVVVEREFVNPGKGSAFVRLKLKNLRDGSAQRVTHKSQDNVEEIDVQEFRAQYLYKDELHYFFMNSTTFEQFEVLIKTLPDLHILSVRGRNSGR